MADSNDDDTELEVVEATAGAAAGGPSTAPKPNVTQPPFLWDRRHPALKGMKVLNKTGGVYDYYVCVQNPDPDGAKMTYHAFCRFAELDVSSPVKVQLGSNSKMAEGKFPTLGPYALRSLGMRPTSVEPERNFSHAGNTVSAKRASLSSTKVEVELMIKGNADLIEDPNTIPALSRTEVVSNFPTLFTDTAAELDSDNESDVEVEAAFEDEFDAAVNTES
jgi:hypothetical protein